MRAVLMNCLNYRHTGVKLSGVGVGIHHFSITGGGAIIL
jgi:hypothetical protein